MAPTGFQRKCQDLGEIACPTLLGWQTAGVGWESNQGLWLLCTLSSVRCCAGTMTLPVEP